jgi:uncharacterized membrane protein YhaH (DUF805 family)
MTTLPNAKPAERHAVRFRLECWHRRCVYATGAVLLLTGVGWLVVHYLMRPAGAFGETPHPLEPWTMKLHGAAAMAALFFVGSMLHMHIRRAHKHGRNRATGWSMIASLLFLVVTGYGLYYVTDEGDHPLWSILHWSVGLAAAPLLVLHIRRGRSSVAGRRAGEHELQQ